MLRLANVEELQSILLQVPALVHLQQQRSPDFPSRVVKWLEALERVLSANRLHNASSIAVLRSELITVERTQVPTASLSRNRPTRSQMLVAASSRALQRAVELATAVVDGDRPRLAEAERIAHQLVAAAKARALFGDASSRNADRTSHLRGVHHRLRGDADLAAATVHLEGLVGPHDLLILLDRADIQPAPSTSQPCDGVK